jgi:hypothetical protein
MAGTAGGYYPQVEEDSEISTTVWVGHGTCHGHGGYHRGSIY